MRNNGTLSKLVHASVVVVLLASFTVLGCSPQATPSPTAPPKPTPTPTATVAPKPTATAPATNQPQYGGILKSAENNEADSPGYPAKLVSAATTLEAGPAVETLLRYDKTGNSVPWLATAYKTDATAKTITFTLRKGVKFHDGTDFNATAVKWNLDQLIAAKAPSASQLGSVDVVDDYTVRVNLTAWASTAIGTFDLTGGLMVSPTASQTNGVDWAVKHPVGTGPFKFASWNPGASLSYSRFDGYWQPGKPYLDGIQFVFISDPLTAEISLRAGEEDMAHQLITTNLDKLQADGFTIIKRYGGAGNSSMVPDSATPKSPWADIRVRQAASYAIDNVALAKAVWGANGGTATNQLTWPGYWAYNPSVVGYPYDPAKAKQLLTAAGYPNGFQTTYQAFNSTQPISYMTGVVGYLKAVGIDVTLQPQTSAQIAQFELSGKSWQGLVLSRWGADPDWVVPASNYFVGHGSYVNLQIPDDYAQAVNNALLAPDFPTKQKFAQQAMQLAIDKYALMIPLYCTYDTYTTWANVHDTGLNDTNTNGVYTPENAWLGKK